MPNGKPKFLETLITNPKRIFLIDAFGALVTSILLFGILAQLETYFGMPSNVLYMLAGIAFCLFVFSLSCFALIKDHWKRFLGILIICNGLYLFISLCLIVNHAEKLTQLGIGYFTIEFIIIGILIAIEYIIYSRN